MRDLGNKLFLFIACSYMIWFTGLDTQSVVAFVVSLIVSSLCTYFENSLRTDLLLVLYSALCLLCPAAFCLYLPLMLYDALYFQKRVPLAILFISFIPALFHLPRFLLPCYFLLIGGAALLSCFSRHLYQLLHQLHQIRDDNMESTMILQQRNMALIEKQDYEIHVATLSERNRIAREIHDNVGHMLTRSILQTGALKVINKDPSLEEPLTTLHDTLNTAMTSIRTSVHDLHDESIDLHNALLDTITPVSSPNIVLEYDMGNELPKEIKYAFISIVKEAVNNMQKHSNADSARITLREHPGFYHLLIQDNGTVISPAENEGIGLSNMKERIHALKGNIRISTENGFTINISIMK